MQIQTSSTAIRRAPAPRPVAQATSAAPRPVSAFATDLPLPTQPAAPFDTAGLTPEEVGFIQQGLLPKNFAALRQAQREGGVEAAKALAREGMKGPFSTRFGDPNVMLSGARRLSRHPEFSQMAKLVKPGDILCVTYNKPQDVITMGTNGPFIHVLVCTEAGPPATFIEAVGLSGDMNDPNSNKVLRSMLSEQGWNDQSVRLLRPTSGLAPHEADKAI